MRNRWNAVLVAGLTTALIFVMPVPQAGAVPPEVHAEPRSRITTTSLTSSRSITVKKQSYTRKYTKGSCAAYEIVARPALVKGGTKARRIAFNTTINRYIEASVDKILESVLNEAVDGNAKDFPCSKRGDKANSATVTVAASIYRNRYVSVALDVWFSYASVASTCRDYYKTFTFDTKTGQWNKLSDFASTNHNQLALTWLSWIGGDAEPYDVKNTFSPELPKGYAVGKEAWTVSNKGVRFWSAAGDHRRSCTAGPIGRTLSWSNILRPGDDQGTKRTYSRIPVRTREFSPIKGRATVTVKGRAIRAQWCRGKTCITYYGVRDGIVFTAVWGVRKHAGAVHGTTAFVQFSSGKNSAKPVAVFAMLGE